MFSSDVFADFFPAVSPYLFTYPLPGGPQIYLLLSVSLCSSLPPKVPCQLPKRVTLLKCHEWKEHFLFRRPPGTAVCFFVLLKNKKITPRLASCCETSVCVVHFIWVLVDRSPHHRNLPRWCSCWVFHWKSQGLGRGEK